MGTVGPSIPGLVRRLRLPAAPSRETHSGACAETLGKVGVGT